MERFWFERALIASAAILAVVACPQPRALAGTTGGIAGSVEDVNGAAIPGVRIEAVSSSVREATATDADGHFALLGLAPDTYTLNVSKKGYRQKAVAGELVFSDETERVAVTMSK